MTKFIKLITVSIISFLSLVSLLTVDVVIENIIVDNQIKDFISKGVYKETVGNFYLYEVDIDEELTSPSIIFNNRGYPESSTAGDIFVQKESQIDVVPYSAAFISYFFGGHAGIVVDGDTTIEVNGAMNNPIFNIVDTCYNNIFYSTPKRDIMGLRVKATDSDIEKAVQYCIDAVGTPYNYTFVFNRSNSYYCTDLLSRAYGKEAGLSYNLDKDGIATSCNDLIISEDTYMIYYMYYVGSEKHLYYAV